MKKTLSAVVLAASLLSPLFASAAVLPQQGGTQPWCSSPTAPGWHVDLVGGGCGQYAGMAVGANVSGPIFFAAGSSVVKFGKTYGCPIWFGNIKCVI